VNSETHTHVSFFLLCLTPTLFHSGEPEQVWLSTAHTLQCATIRTRVCDVEAMASSTTAAPTDDDTAMPDLASESPLAGPEEQALHRIETTLDFGSGDDSAPIQLSHAALIRKLSPHFTCGICHADVPVSVADGAVGANATPIDAVVQLPCQHPLCGPCHHRWMQSRAGLGHTHHTCWCRETVVFWLDVRTQTCRTADLATMERQRRQADRLCLMVQAVRYLCTARHRGRLSPEAHQLVAAVMQNKAFMPVVRAVAAEGATLAASQPDQFELRILSTAAKFLASLPSASAAPGPPAPPGPPTTVVHLMGPQGASSSVLGPGTHPFLQAVLSDLFGGSSRSGRSDGPSSSAPRFRWRSESNAPAPGAASSSASGAVTGSTTTTTTTSNGHAPAAGVTTVVADPLVATLPAPAPVSAPVMTRSSTRRRDRPAVEPRAGSVAATTPERQAKRAHRAPA